MDGSLASGGLDRLRLYDGLVPSRIDSSYHSSTAGFTTSFTFHFSVSGSSQGLVRTVELRSLYWLQARRSGW